MNSYCLIVPIYNHEGQFQPLAEKLARYQMECYLVDDGSSQQCKAVIQKITERYSFLKLITLGTNQGKGAAVCTALKSALADGYTHAIQIDSDGQHSPDDIPAFIAASERRPRAVISGFRPYDRLPPSRRRGRRLTDVWVCINTLSMAIRDSMCGFRLYPLKETVEVINTMFVGKRMDFDTDVLVKLYWTGMAVVHVPVSVEYKDGIPSHFALWRDNLRITRMHTKHFFGMLRRFPALIRRSDE
ncbi:MAG: glycosyltransferase family 2 protein [Pseudomonadales bacterium]